jgi:hypothetical protein
MEISIQVGLAKHDVNGRMQPKYFNIRQKEIEQCHHLMHGYVRLV